MQNRKQNGDVWEQAVCKGAISVVQQILTAEWFLNFMIQLREYVVETLGL